MTRVRVHREGYGWGTALKVNADGLVFVRWDGGSVAGGWCDVARPEYTLENASALAGLPVVGLNLPPLLPVFGARKF